MTHLVDDIADYLAINGLGTVATDIFVGYLPESPNDVLIVIDTGGPKPDPYIPTKEPTFQVFIRSDNYDLGKTKLNSVRSLLHQKSNFQPISNGTYFLFILAMSEGGHVGRDEAGFDTFSINFQCRTR